MGGGSLAAGSRGGDGNRGRTYKASQPSRGKGHAGVCVVASAPARGLRRKAMPREGGLRWAVLLVHELPGAHCGRDTIARVMVHKIPLTLCKGKWVSRNYLGMQGKILSISEGYYYLSAGSQMCHRFPHTPTQKSARVLKLKEKGVNPREQTGSRCRCPPTTGPSGRLPHRHSPQGGSLRWVGKPRLAEG